MSQWAAALAVAVCLVAGLSVGFAGSSRGTGEAAVAVSAQSAEQKQSQQLDERLRRIQEDLDRRKREFDARPGATATGFGESLVSGDVVVSADAPARRSDPYLGSQECVLVSYRNVSSVPVSYNMFDWKFLSSGGAGSSPSAAFTASTQSLDYGSVEPGRSVSGLVCASPQDLAVASLVYTPAGGTAVSFS